MIDIQNKVSYGQTAYWQNKTNSWKMLSDNNQP